MSERTCCGSPSARAFICRMRLTLSASAMSNLFRPILSCAAPEKREPGKPLVEHLVVEPRRRPAVDQRVRQPNQEKGEHTGEDRVGREMCAPPPPDRRPEPGQGQC